MVWLASQTQYEAVRFADALSGFGTGTLTREETQLRLDLLASRIVVLEEGEPRRQIEGLGYADQLDDYRRVLTAAQERLEELEPGEAGEVARLREDIISLAHAMRDVA